MKKKVLEEMDERIDFKITSRSYVDSISIIHESIRNKINKITEDSRKCIQKMQTRYTEEYNGNLAGLSACKIRNGKKIESIALFLGWDDVRISLEKRNRKLNNLSKGYITGAS
jgi:hypothetical protein